MGTNKVVVDSDLKKLIPVFLEHRKDEIKKLKKLIKEDNFKEIENLGHALKGTGGGYGFDLVTELGSKIEEAAVREDRENLTRLIKELDQHIENVEVVYD